MRHCKALCFSSKRKNASTNIHEKQNQFYEKDIVSRVLPCKNVTKVVKDHERLKKRLPICVMELTMSDAHKLFL